MSPLRPVQNPPNRFARDLVEYLGEEIPDAELQIYEDHTQNVLAENDSPDLGFRWSINPYRGCFHACAYCVSGDTRVLLPDGGTRAISELRSGDTILGTVGSGEQRRYEKTQVLDHWSVTRPAIRIGLTDGTSLVASEDHPFLTPSGWTPVRNLALGDHLMSLGTQRMRLIASVQPLGLTMELFDITTGTGDFIANGVISHNCYARPTHEYLSFGAGTDFERKIVIKPDAPALLRARFEKPSWQGELIMLSGNTDCYQPLENSYRLTRGILEVCAEYRNPVHIITKSPLIERDIDLLVKLEQQASVGVSLSIPFWKPETARALEPFVTTPERRMKAAARLAAAGIDVTINIAPLILGLGDRDVPAILEAAAAAGARRAALIPLRLPGAVKQVFEERLRATLPLSADKVLRRTREMRGGKLYDARFGERMSGQGEYFEAIQHLFESSCRRLGLSQEYRERPNTFRRPTDKGGQLRLFDR